MSLEPLIAAILAMALHLAPDVAREHVTAAVAAAHAHHAALQLSEHEAAELLLGMAYIESRYIPTALSRREPQAPGVYRRVTGIWAAHTPPPRARSPWFCGPLQAGGRVPWRVCQRMRTDLAYGYAAGAAELGVWYNDLACRSRPRDARLSCALHGYGGGYAAVAAGTHAYPAKVRRAARRIAGLAQRRALN